MSEIKSNVVKTIQGKGGMWEILDIIDLEKPDEKKYWCRFFLTHEDSCNNFGTMFYTNSVNSIEELESAIEWLKKSF